MLVQKGGAELEVGLFEMGFAFKNTTFLAILA